MRPGERLDTIRAKLAAGVYPIDAACDIAYLFGTLEMIERLFEAAQVSAMDPDNEEDAGAG